MFVTHFGNGDEADQDLVIKYIREQGCTVEAITIIPGNNYGLVVLGSAQESQTILKSLMDTNATIYEKRTLVFFCTNLAKDQMRKQEVVDFPEASIAKTGSLPGLYVFDEFITEEESQVLVKALDAGNWQKLLNRRVQHFGFEFKYGTNDVDVDNSIGKMPDFLTFLQPRISQILRGMKLNADFEVTGYTPVDDAAMEEESKDEDVYSKYGDFDQLTVNDYMPGQGIPPHVDTHSPFQEVFASLSLKSGTTMHFKDPTNKVIDIYLQPRSLLVFSGEARYNWLHSIALRKVDKVDGLLKFRHRRISLTFRKVKTDPCKCKFPQLCDSQNKSAIVNENMLGNNGDEEAIVNKENEGAITATNMEKQHVYDVYEKIAPHFSNTRYKPWPKVAEFLNKLPDGSIVADVGCGNGKYLGVNKQLQMIGTDRSFNLIQICAERSKMQFQTFVADSLRLPLRSNSFDNVISIAVVHHFSNTSLRVQALSEMHRILRQGGTMLVYVWAYEQEHKKFATQDVFVPWHLHDTYEESKKEEHKESKPEESKFIETAIKDDDKQATVYHRYYHVFVEGEMEKLVAEHFEGKLELVNRYYDHANWVVELKKL